MRRALGLLCVVVCTPASAHAFCGFYVAGSDAEIFNHATQVVMLRHGDTTVLSMQNDYQGPPQDFAMVVPVPVVLDEDHVKTLDRRLFERVSRLASPRLVEYWEQDPCLQRELMEEAEEEAREGAGSGYGRGAGGFGGSLVTVEAQFEVGEYEIVILSAREAGALDTWLREHDYRIPEGAEPLLRPYVEADMKFFVARVDPERVTFEDGRAVLSPLRFHYPSETFSLPVRLGLINSSGSQDLLVHILADDQRYEVANYDNVIIPTNLDVADSVRDRFGAFYESLFAATVEANPGAVVTEYAWQASNCDPCPGPVLNPRDIASLGADVTHPDTQMRAEQGTGRVRVLPGPPLDGPLSEVVLRRTVRRQSAALRACYEAERANDPLLAGTVLTRFTVAAGGQVSGVEVAESELENAAAEACLRGVFEGLTFEAPQGASGPTAVGVRLRFSFTSGRTFGGGPFANFVLTRLHYRYRGDALGEDLVFRAADAIVGGREFRTGDGLEHGATPARRNNFQGRYVIRHRWEGEIACDDPLRGVWGGPPSGTESDTIGASSGFGRGAGGEPVELASVLYQPVPEAGVEEVDNTLPPLGEGSAQASSAPEAEADDGADETAEESGASGGCGCRAASLESVGRTWIFAMAAMLFAIRRFRV